LPIYFAMTLSMYTLIPTVYRALLKSAVSGTDHRIHTTKKTHTTKETRHTVSFSTVFATGKTPSSSERENWRDYPS